MFPLPARYLLQCQACDCNSQLGQNRRAVLGLIAVPLAVRRLKVRRQAVSVVLPPAAAGTPAGTFVYCSLHAGDNDGAQTTQSIHLPLNAPDQRCHLVTVNERSPTAACASTLSARHRATAAMADTGHAAPVPAGSAYVNSLLRRLQRAAASGSMTAVITCTAVSHGLIKSKPDDSATLLQGGPELAAALCLLPWPRACFVSMLMHAALYPRDSLPNASRSARCSGGHVPKARITLARALAKYGFPEHACFEQLAQNGDDINLAALALVKRFGTPAAAPPAPAPAPAPAPLASSIKPIGAFGWSWGLAHSGKRAW
jgi:hypothetical protein